MEKHRLEKLMQIIDSAPTAFYLERNHHWTKGKGLTDALDDLIAEGLIDDTVASRCERAKTLWYCRYYPSNRNGFYETFGASAESVLLKLLSDIEEFENEDA